MADTPAPGGKTVGTGFGATAAALYAEDLTTLTIHAARIDQLPPEVLGHANHLLAGLWTGLLLFGGLYAGHLWNKASAKWGNGNGDAPVANP